MIFFWCYVEPTRQKFRLINVVYKYENNYMCGLLNCITMIEHLTAETFKQKVFDYEKNTEWKYEGNRPAIVDFYADWCGPCKMVAPILEELSKEYDGKLNIYKVDTEAEQELAGVFGIRSIPSLLFIPLNDQPQMAMGALPKDAFKKAFKDVLGVE
jgi:thioredoxin